MSSWHDLPHRMAIPANKASKLPRVHVYSLIRATEPKLPTKKGPMQLRFEKQRVTDVLRVPFVVPAPKARWGGHRHSLCPSALSAPCIYAGGR